MTKEVRSWKEQLLEASYHLGLRWPSLSERRRGEFESYVEARLDELVESDNLISWRPATKEERSRGMQYLLNTQEGAVPFAFSSTHRKAQAKRKRWPELEDTTLSLIGQHDRRLKPPQIIRDQILRQIETYWMHQQAPPASELVWE